LGLSFKKASFHSPKGHVMQKTIFITGSSTGLGRATALLFAARDWNVIATMRHPEREAELGRVPGITLMPMDVTDLAQIDRASNEAISRGPIDVVFANAGYALAGPLEAVSDEQISRQFATNLMGSVRTVKAFVKHFRERGSGVFLLTSSGAGHVGMPLLSTYAASKFALEGWAESLSYELAPRGVQVKTIVPGSMKTSFMQSVEQAQRPDYAVFADKVGRYYRAAAESSIDGTPEQVAEAVWTAATDGKDQVAYLVTDDARQLIAARTQLGSEGFRAYLSNTVS
jgi:NAD(P)-dependent dehydrogenase (short-subunit alcohol dehydrogenase family)